MELTGKLIAALPTRSGVSQRSGNTWMRREYVIEIPGQYPIHFVFTVFGEDRLKEFNLRKDEEITVHFDIDAHEFNGRWFNEVRAYKVDRVGQQQPTTQQQTEQQPATANQASSMPQAAPQQTSVVFPPQQPESDGSADDLPF